MVSLSTRYSFFKRWLKSKTHVDLHHTEPVPAFGQGVEVHLSGPVKLLHPDLVDIG
jgi:hypothetical protein